MTNIRRVLLDSNRWWKGEFELEFQMRDIVELKEKASELPHIRLKSFQYGKTAAFHSISTN
jgi:hypothetical protein